MKIIAFILHRTFEKNYRKLDTKIREQFKIKRDLLVINPQDPSLNLHTLKGEWRGHWSINITGNVRAIFKVEARIAQFIDIGTHSELYE